MSRAEDLLNVVSEEIPVHAHPVPDTDTYFIIDPITRKIENTNRKKTVVMQYDHNSERFTFELPRYIDGHDMLECTSVTVNVDNIEVIEPGEGEEAVEPRINSDAPDMTDLRTHPNDSEKVITSWLISRNSTQLAGILSFHIEFKCVDSSGNVVYEWSTDSFEEIQVKARKKNGDAAVMPYTDVLEQWRTNIFGAGDSVMANIAAEGKTQVAAVKMESETQQEAVELKGAQTLDSIPEDYTEVDVMANEAVRTKADAIICSANGETIAVHDSSDDYVRGLRVFGKTTQVKTTGAQKLPYPYTQESRTTNGITYTVNNDGSITISGTSTAKAYLDLYNKPSPEIPGSHFLSGIPKNSGFKMYAYTGGAYKEDTGNGMLLSDGVTSVHIVVESDVTVNTTIYPMLNEGTSALPWEPYTGGIPGPNPNYPQELVSIENTSVDVYGKNLWDHTNDQIDMLNGQGWGNPVWTNNAVVNTLRPNTTYTLSFDVTCLEIPEYSSVFSGHCGFVLYSSKPNAVPTVMARYEGDVFDVGDKTFVSATFTTPSNVDDPEMNYEILRYTQRFLKEDGNAVHATVRFENVQLETNSVSTKFDECTKQTLSIIRTISGIPVTSGGNYTDSDGQQWICDEIDLERGVYVKRIKTVTLDGSDNEGWMLYDNNVSQGTSFVYYPYDGVKYFQSSMCDKYRNVNVCWGEPYKGQMGIYSDHNSVSGRYFRPPNESVNSLEAWQAWLAENPLTLTYILATPIETPLTAEEITAFKALRTNYPNTTILNDAGAWMSVKYNADTKSYIENPKTLKLVDSSTGVVYELKIVDGNLVVNPV